MRRIKLRIAPPTEPVPPGRGFYQLEEEALHIPIGVPPPDRRFFSWLESDLVQMDIDRTGKLLFVAVNCPRRQWSWLEGLAAPQAAAMADVRWVNFRTRMAEPRLLTDRRRSLVKVVWLDEIAARTYYLADHVLLQTDADLHPTAIWVTDISDDLAGREIMECRKEWRRQRHRVGAFRQPVIPSWSA